MAFDAWHKGKAFHSGGYLPPVRFGGCNTSSCILTTPCVGKFNKYTLRLGKTRDMKLLTFYVAVLISMAANPAFAEDIVVGGTAAAWKLGVVYENITAKVGDNLVFNFDTGKHDVAQLASQDCASKSTVLSTTGPFKMTLDKPGTMVIACTFPGHCDGGMTFSVVTAPAAGGSTSPNPVPAAKSPAPAKPEYTSPSPSTPSGAGHKTSKLAAFFVASGLAALVMRAYF